MLQCKQLQSRQAHVSALLSGRNVSQQQRRVVRAHGRNANLVKAAAAAVEAAPPTNLKEYYYRDQSPWPTDVPIAQHDPVKNPYVDLVIAGAGPSGLAVGERVAKAGYKVCIIDPAPLGIWPNNYGVWVDEFEAMGLGDCLEVVWPKAKVFLDSDNLGAK